MSDDSFSLDMSDEENMPSLSNRLKAKAAGKAGGAKKKPVEKKTSKKKQDSDEEDDVFDVDEEIDFASNNNKSKASSRRTSMERAQLSNKYQKKTQYEHIILRPDTYIGSTEKVKQGMWVFEDGGMKFRNVSYVPGLYKIFDEILVNASDNKQRDASMKALKVKIDEETGSISVWNDGKGIPVEVHAEHKVYIPELVFGHLMTGENFEDTQQRVVGGRNGYGAKLANIFSKEFIVETNDTKSGKRYKQRWTANMSNKEEPKITKATGKDFTCVTFVPDYERFGMPDGLDSDTLALLTKRVYDAAGVTDKSVKVSLNDKVLPINSFQQYIDLYIPSKASENQDDDNDDDEEEEEEDDDWDDEGSKASKAKKKKKASTSKKGAEPNSKVYEKVNDRWEICIVPSPDGQMQQVSFVNGICTMKGGQHVNYIADQVSSRLQAFLKKKQKGSEFKPHQIKSHLWIFVNALIVNPAFDSQTKETLTTRSSKFGPTEFLPKLSDKTFKQLEKSPIVGNILFWAKAHEMRELSRKAGATKTIKIKGVDKLDDANNAGGRHSQKCTLILTEGDSAKTLAISGLSVVGRDNYGVFPLRGKLLNVRDAAHTQIMKNEEIKAIMKIMGLQPGKKYHDTKGLRYGHLLIMTDQDHDGSHIKGLIMNFIHHFWPELLAVPGFLQVFITPIVKVTKGKQTTEFYTMPQYETWSQSLTDAERKRWTVKYYKGLGTSTAKEAKEYFSDLPKHRINMAWEGDEAGDALDMAFSKKRVSDRKDWLNAFEPGTYMDYNVQSIQFRTFVNNELILFSMADNIRSIPSVVDGLKPSQRKVLFSCFKRNLKSDIKVAQLVGYVSEHSAYHHGEVSLASTVVGMAQNFVGSNNVNLLFPSGQFGSRLLGGKDAASPRYIFTRLAPLTRALFHENDDALLTYLNDDGMSIEPEHYVPIIPMVLVNGSSGIGTGWSTDIPCYNPRDLVQYLRRKLICCEPEALLQPWYRGFDGEIEPEMHATKGFTGRFKISGLFERDEDNEAIIITELPIGVWTQTYKQFLMDEKNFAPGFIKDIRENHTDTKVSFSIFLSSEAYNSVLTDNALKKKFRLETTISTSNMHAYDFNGMIKKYNTPEDILDEFFDYRLNLYEKRKQHLVSVLETEWSKLNNKARFIQMVVDEELIVTKRKKAELLGELRDLGFDMFFKAKSNNKKEAEQDDGSDSEQAISVDDDSTTAELAKGYDYLLSMAIWTLTHERVQELHAQKDKKRQELDLLLSKRASDLWEEDLVALEQALDAQDEMDEKDMALEAKQRQGSRKTQLPRKKKTTTVNQLEKKLSKSVKLESSDEDEDFALPVSSKPSRVTNNNKRKPAKSTTKVSAKALETTVKKEAPKSLEKEDSDVEILSLSERLKQRMMVSPAPTKASKKQSKKRVKEETPIKLASVDTEDTPAKKPAGKKRRLKSAQKAKQKKVIDSSESEEEEQQGEKEIKDPTPRPARRGARKKVATYVESSDEDDDFVLDDDDEEEEFDDDDASEESEFDEDDE